jgi:branched-chain amino acid transport system ATP-binding protein
MRHARPGERERSASALAIADLAVVYSDAVHALRGVTLDVEAGTIFAVLGANGAGKTTLLRAVTGLLGAHQGRIVRGTIELDGASLTRSGAAARVRAGLAQVLEGRRVFAELTVEENLRTGAFTSRDPTATAAARDSVLVLFPRLGERLGQVAGYLSGGEQQMLAIGRALMARPRLLVLDEPSLGLAPQLVSAIRDAIVAINRSGTTVLLVEQNARMALSIATRAAVLANGRVQVEGAASELAGDEAVRASYFGAVPGEPLHGTAP